MNRSILILLLSSAVVALPAGAQSSSSSSSSSVSSDSADSVREPLTDPRPLSWWDGDDPNVVNLVTHPFARKPWIKRQITPIRDRINELDEITSENATKIKDVDARSQKGLQLASEKVNLADQHAGDAVSRAQTAQTTADQASTRVSSAVQMVNNLDQYKSGAQTEIRFRPGQTVLSKQAKDALDAMASPVKNQHNYIIEVRGFSPGQGHAGIAASQKMADSVLRYLVETDQVPVYRIFVLGLGNASTAEESGSRHSTRARVEVNVLENDGVNTAQR